MKEIDFINDLKIKDTILDRRFKRTPSQRRAIIEAFSNGESYGDIARRFNTSYASVRTLIDPEYKAKRAAAKKAWYNGLTTAERASNNRKWQQSTREYKQKLYKVFLGEDK